MLYKIGPGKKIKEELINEGSSETFPCNGTGKCGKCLIKVIEGHLEPDAQDRKFLSLSQIKDGFRLSCQKVTTEEIVFSFLSHSDEAKIESSVSPGFKLGEHLNRKQKYGFAVDIGTTTVVIALVNLYTFMVVDTYSCLNSQRLFGSDVISRINYAMNNNLADLHNSIIKDLEKGFSVLLERTGVKAGDIDKIVIAANNVMNHIFLNVNPASIGIAPYEPVFTDTKVTPAKELFKLGLNCDAVVIGSFSAYVGGDIVSGLLTTDIDTSDDWILFVDLGTNGEIVLGKKGKLFATSTAVGPAFEGGNIECGIGSIAGAVNKMNIEQDKITYTTILDREPVGFCGSGIIDLLAQLKNNGWVKEDGKLVKQEKGRIYITESLYFSQKDVRQLQLAKSAVRSGIDMLLLKAGITYKDVRKMLVSGGFGSNADLKSMIDIGLIPNEFADRVTPCGNTSLKGAVTYLINSEAEESVSELKKIATVLNLAHDEQFNELFVENFKITAY